MRKVGGRRGPRERRGERSRVSKEGDGQGRRKARRPNSTPSLRGADSRDSPQTPSGRPSAVSLGRAGERAGEAEAAPRAIGLASDRRAFATMKKKGAAFPALPSPERRSRGGASCACVRARARTGGGKRVRASGWNAGSVTCPSGRRPPCSSYIKDAAHPVGLFRYGFAAASEVSSARRACARPSRV